MHAILPFALGLALLGAPGCAAARTTSQPAAAGPQQPQQSKAQKKEKKKKKPAEPVPGPGDSPDAAKADRSAVSRVLQDFQDGFEGRSPRRVTENLHERFEDLPRFEDAVTEFLRQSGEMRLFLREASGEVKGDHATLIVDGEMVFTAKDRPGQEQRRRERIQFDFVYTGKGWKIYEISPRQFFTP